ncbi:MAG: S8 family serine peptidase, partial [Actinomycetota bacterium]
APPVEPSCDTSDQCIAVADTGMWEEPPPPSRLNRANPANQVFYENGDVETVSNAPPGGNALWYGAGHGGFIGGILTARADGVPIHLGNAFDGAIHALTIESIVNCVNRLLSSKPVPTVLNLSLGTYTEPGVDVVGLRDAVERWTRKVLVVSAAGNHATTEPFYPAAFAAEGHLRDLVVSVGATDPAGGQAPYSNFGEWVTAWAPGSHISFYPKGITYLAPPPDAAQTFHDGYATWDGTSFATPFVAAEITRYAIDHGLTPQQAWAAIRGATPQVVFG